MTKPLLHFAHANSFPAGTYRAFFEELGRHYRVQALDMHAHNPRYPVRDGWQALARELSDELAARYRRPVILVGHSLGGVLSLMAAKAHPERVRCVVLLDVPVVAGWRAMAWRLLKASGRSDRFSPAQFSIRRRQVWPDAAAAQRYFSSKEKFAIWPPGVLQDYLACGLRPHPEGVALGFSRETETEVYRSLPHDLGRLLRGKFPVPVGFVGGVDSEECRRAGLNATRRLVGDNFVQIPGGHLLPLETPAAAAHATRAMILRLLRG
jgi:pimeloyl-ACP methyl ester carboxylesterase